MKYKQISLLALALFLASYSYGQLEKTLHQTFALDEKTMVNFDLYGEYTLVPWAGNNILVETKIQLYNSSASILKHFIEKDLRYQVDADTSAKQTLRLVSHDKKRATLRTRAGVESTEIVETRVFVPENYVIRDDKTLVLEAPKN